MTSIEFRVEKVASVVRLADQEELAKLFGEEAAAEIAAKGEMRTRYGESVRKGPQSEITDLEREVLRMHFGLIEGRQALSLTQTGRELGFSRHKARRLVEKALGKLRSPRNFGNFSEEAYILQSPQGTFVVDPTSETPGVLHNPKLSGLGKI